MASRGASCGVDGAGCVHEARVSTGEGVEEHLAPKVALKPSRLSAVAPSPVVTSMTLRYEECHTVGTGVLPASMRPTEATEPWVSTELCLLAVPRTSLNACALYVDQLNVSAHTDPKVHASQAGSVRRRMRRLLCARYGEWLCRRRSRCATAAHKTPAMPSRHAHTKIPDTSTANFPDTRDHNKCAVDS